MRVFETKGMGRERRTGETEKEEEREEQKAASSERTSGMMREGSGQSLFLKETRTMTWPGYSLGITCQMTRQAGIMPES